MAKAKVKRKGKVATCVNDGCGFELFAPEGILGKDFPCRCNADAKGFRWFEAGEGIRQAYAPRGRVLIIEDLASPACRTRHPWTGFLWGVYGEIGWRAWIDGNADRPMPVSKTMAGFDMTLERAKADVQDRAVWWFKDSKE